ncbi:hypothetical protein BGD37_RS24820, partial [Escherichia coli]
CLPTNPVSLFWLSRPGFPREHFIRKLRQPDNCFQWKHNKLYLLLPEEYGPAFPAIVDCYTCPRYFIRTPYNGVLASQTRHDYCPQSSMIRGVMSPGLVGRW